MRILLLLFVFILSVASGQETPKQFGSEILTYHMIGHAINKQPNMIIFDSKGVKIEDKDSCYQVLKDGNDEHYVTTAYVLNEDTVFLQRYNYRFISLPFPEIRWTALEQFEILDPYNDKYPVIGLHRDSLAYFKEFEVHHFVSDLPELKWEVIKGELIVPGMYNGLFFEGKSIPDRIIDTLKALGDTLMITLQLKIRGQDGVIRNKSGSIMLVKLDGLKYELHRNPLYFYENYSDTVQMTKKQLYSEDTLQFHNPGRIYLKLPRLEKDYFFKWYSEYGFCYDVPYTKVEAGKGYVIIDAGSRKGLEVLQLTFEEDRYKIDETGYFNKKKIFFTYPEP